MWGGLGLPQTTGLREITASVPGVVFFGLATLVTSWAALIPARLLETTDRGWFSRRLVAVACGVGGGLLIWWMSQRLLVNLQEGGPLGPPLWTEFGELPLVDGHQSLSPAAFAVWLAGLLGLAGWGGLAQSRRKRSFRWMGVVGVVLVAVGSQARWWCNWRPRTNRFPRHEPGRWCRTRPRSPEATRDWLGRRARGPCWGSLRFSHAVLRKPERAHAGHTRSDIK